MKYRATVSYDGTEFIGFQRQASGRTVQEELEQAIGRVGEAQITVNGAGRTDTGVHATGQVISFELARWPHGDARLQKAINMNLPMDVAVRDVAKARGMAQLAKDTGLGRESLYKALAPGAKPRYETILKLMKALGIRLHAIPVPANPTILTNASNRTLRKRSAV